jgi:hypothetical protein
MIPQISTISNVGDAITLVVKYGNQSKPVNVTPKDDLSSLESKIYERFKFNSEQIEDLQVQWYDDDLKQFIDLDDETWPKYTDYLQYGDNKVNNGSERHLKLVHKQLFRQHNNTEGKWKRCFMKKMTIHIKIKF